MEIKLNLSNTEHKELISFCNLNDLLVSEVVKKSFISGFNIERYGLLNLDKSQERIIEKEVIREKIVEVPVEVIREVVKEIPVEKIVTVYDDSKVNELLLQIQKLENEPPKVVEIVKEIPIEKIVYVTDEKELNEKIFQKDQELEEYIKKFSIKIEDMENFFQKEKEELYDKIRELENKPAETIEVVKEVIIRPDENKSKMMEDTLHSLRLESLEKDKKIKELESNILEYQKNKLNLGAVFLRGSNLDETLYK